MYVVEGPKIFYRLAISALHLYASLAQSAGMYWYTHRCMYMIDRVIFSPAGSDIEMCVQELLSQLSITQKAQWFNNAFTIQRLPWTPILTRWVRSQGENTIDAPDDSFSPPPIYSRHVTPDLSSEILTSVALWNQVWSWLPDWVTGENPECVFRASRDGYK